MNLYLSARESRWAEMNLHADEMRTLGLDDVEVVSLWHAFPPLPVDEDEEESPDDADDESSDPENLHMPAPSAAQEDMATQTGNTPRTDDGGEMTFHAKDNGEPGNMKSRRELVLADRASKNMAAVLKCDIFVVFTNDPPVENHTREAAYAEYGVAMASLKKIIIVGKRYHYYHYFRDVKVYASFKNFLKDLARWRQQRA